MTETVSQALKIRFGDVPELGQGAGTLASMLTRGSCRAFGPGAPSRADVALLCAAAMSAPTKSDLQQRDIIVLDDPQQRAALAGLVGGQTWVAQAPLLAGRPAHSFVPDQGGRPGQKFLFRAVGQPQPIG